MRWERELVGESAILFHDTRPDGWLGALLGTKLYFDISRESDARFEPTLGNLMRVLTLLLIS